jgi:hypothetical protein
VALCQYRCAPELQPNSIQPGAGGDVERLLVGISTGAVGGDFGHFDQPKKLAGERKDLNAALHIEKGFQIFDCS